MAKHEDGRLIVLLDLAALFDIDQILDEEAFNVSRGRMIRIDLHLHSTFSDGSMTPEALVAHGRKSKGVTVMSLTDHIRSTGSLRSWRRARMEHGRYSGIELSADHAYRPHPGVSLDLRRAGASSLPRRGNTPSMGMKNA